MNIFNKNSELKDLIRSQVFGDMLKPFLWKGLVTDIDIDGTKFNSVPGSLKVRVKGLHDYLDLNEDLPIVLPFWHHSGMRLRIPQVDDFVFLMFEYLEPIGQAYWITSISTDISTDYEKVIQFAQRREVIEEIIPIENNEIIKHVLSPETYFQEQFDKDGIVYHHTASNGDPLGVIDFWNNDKVEVATAYIIGFDGKIYQTFEDDKHWAYHIKTDRLSTEKRTIGIEYMNVGPIGLNEFKGYFDTYGKFYGREQIIDLGNWRDYRYFVPYTQEQIKSGKDLTNHLCQKHNIEKNFLENFFEFSPNNITFKGLMGHCSLRADKTDPHLKFPITLI